MGFRKKHDITDIYHVRDESKPGGHRLSEPDTNRTRSRNYHNYFRGYTEVQIKNEKGRIRTERYYAKPWIVSDLSTRNYWLVRILYALLTVLSAILYTLGMVQEVPGNRHWVVALPGMPAMIVLFLLVVVCFQYISVPKKMTQWDHASSTKRLKAFSLATGIAQALTSITLAAFTLITGKEVVSSLFCAAGVLTSAICSGSIFFIERKMTYSEIPNNTKIPDGEAFQIR